MKRIVFLPLIFSVLLLAGQGCPSATGDKTAPAASQPESEKPSTVTEPFDTNDYLDAALEELNAVE